MKTKLMYVVLLLSAAYGQIHSENSNDYQRSKCAFWVDVLNHNKLDMQQQKLIRLDAFCDMISRGTDPKYAVLTAAFGKDLPHKNCWLAHAVCQDSYYRLMLKVMKSCKQIALQNDDARLTENEEVRIREILEILLDMWQEQDIQALEEGAQELKTFWGLSDKILSLENRFRSQ